MWLLAYLHQYLPAWKSQDPHPSCLLGVSSQCYTEATALLKIHLKQKAFIVKIYRSTIQPTLNNQLSVIRLWIAFAFWYIQLYFTYHHIQFWMFCISVKCENTNYKYWKRQCSRKYYEGIGLFSILHNKDLCGFTGYLVITGQWILEDCDELDMKLVYRKEKNFGEKTSWKMKI